MVDEYNRYDALRRFQRGQALERANRIKEAMYEYHQALAVYPHLAEAHYALGSYYQRCGMLTRAAEAFRSAANLAGDFRCFFALGYVLARLEQYDEALQALQQSLFASPNEMSAHYEICLILCARGEHQRALDRLSIVLQLVPHDWSVHLLQGNCYLGLGRNEEALTAFETALQLTQSVRNQAMIVSRIALIDDQHQSRRVIPNGKTIAAEQVMYLGSAQDDGLHPIETQHYHFTYPDIGTTLQRFRALCQTSRWPFTAIVALDKLGQPFAAAIAQLLALPLRTVSELGPDDTALLVLAVARESELLQLTIERIPSRSMSFCLGLNWLRHSQLLPQIVGITAHQSCSVPWEAELRRLRSDGAPLQQVDDCLRRATDEIMAALPTTPLDAASARQLRHDTRPQHRLNLPFNPSSGFSPHH